MRARRAEAENRPRRPGFARSAMTEHSGALSSSRVGVLTVDDQVVFRRVARDVVEATAGFETVGEAASGEEALLLASELHPDLVLVDVRMPGIDGMETSRRLKAAHPEAVIVLVSADDYARLPSGTGSCGAVALIPKEHFRPATLQVLWKAHGPSLS